MVQRCCWRVEGLEHQLRDIKEIEDTCLSGHDKCNKGKMSAS
jgi:hypothetical protein